MGIKIVVSKEGNRIQVAECNSIESRKKKKNTGNKFKIN